jgi:hypothetical protein
MSTKKTNPVQGTFGNRAKAADTGPVECLGMEFPSEYARREHFTERLREKLKDKAFRSTPGFPQGTDEAILRMSDPPHYTACPNPFLVDFVRVHGRPWDPKEKYEREPFAVDVSEGKTDALYKAHGYHTKVPHLAIVPSILHYTEPGDLVLDGFCGSGMTGLAAQWCGTAPGEYQRKLEMDWKQAGHAAPKWGARRVVLNDLGPAASFIAAGYNLPFDVERFEQEAQRILDEVEQEIGWMYETLHTDGKTKGRINYTVWSEVFSCPECAKEVNFLEEAFDEDRKETRRAFPCPHCSAELTKAKLGRLYESQLDASTGHPVKLPKRHPLLINYTAGSAKFEKAPDAKDLDRILKVVAMGLPPGMPTNRMMNAAADAVAWGDEWRAGVAAFSHVHHLFLARPAHALASMWRRASARSEVRLRNALLFLVEQTIVGMSVMNRYVPTHFSQVNRYMSGRLRVLSQHSEVSPWYILDGKLKRLVKAFDPVPSIDDAAMISTGDCAAVSLPDASVEYVFTDPPFGHNFAYAELNFVTEAWHGVTTHQGPEAIVSSHQKKALPEYQELMQKCFRNYHRVLKPGRWMTVVFSNSSNAVWHTIQEAMGAAGFVIADVRTLDKKQGSFNQVHRVSVDQDLIISAYRPTQDLAHRFKLGHSTPDAAWAFVKEHLQRVPLFVSNDGQLETVRERTPQVLLDRMTAFHVQRGLSVPLSAAEFLAGLQQRFPPRDGMHFLPEQVVEYAKKRMSASALRQRELFVVDEVSAIQWVRQQLQDKPQSFQDLQPQFMQQAQSWAKHEQTIELKLMLEQNFLRYDGKGPLPPTIHSYLSRNFKDLRNLDKEDRRLKEKAADRWYVPDHTKDSDLVRLRERALLVEFEEYKASTERKLKLFRTEAVRAGFKDCWQRNDYATIVKIGEKMPENVLQEDETLLMYYDNSLTRSSTD